MDAFELKVLRKQTRAFIKTDPTVVRMSRKTRTGDGAGGSTYTYGDPGAEQTVKMVPVGEGRAQLASRNVDGEVINPSYVLIAEHDADIKIGDRFKLDGRDYDVIYVRPDRDYETWVEVAYRG